MTTKVSTAVCPPFPVTTIENAGFSGVTARIETENLMMESVKKEDLHDYTSFFIEQNILEFAAGSPPSDEEGRKKAVAELTTRLFEDVWLQQWQSGDPYSSMAIFSKKKKEFLGHFVLSRTSSAGEASGAVLVREDAWKEEYEREFVYAVYDYAVSLLKKGYSVAGAPLKKVVFKSIPNAQIDEKTVPQYMKEVQQGTVEVKTEGGGPKRIHYILNIQGTV